MSNIILANIDDLADKDLKDDQYDNSLEIQSSIDDRIYFKFNSVNLVIGKRGSGKTYTVMREILKLAYLMKQYDANGWDDEVRYTQVYYITDKLRDDTCQRAQYYIENKTSMQFIWEKTENALDLIQYISMIKAFLADPSQYDEDLQNPEFIHECMDVINYHPPDTDEGRKQPLPHTVIIFDDCIGLFNKYSPLSKKLFENRQTRIT